MAPWLNKLTSVLKSPWWLWGTFATVIVIGILYFVYAWTGHAPTTGPDHTNPDGPATSLRQPSPPVRGPSR